MPNTIARRIQERRKALILFQRDLAGDKYTTGYISQIENGRVNPPIDTLEYIAAILKVPVTYLIDETIALDSVNLTSSNVDSLLNKLITLPTLLAQERYEEVIEKSQLIRQQLIDSNLERYVYLCDYYIGKAHYFLLQFSDTIIYLQKCENPLQYDLVLDNYADCCLMLGFSTMHSVSMQAAEKYFNLALAVIVKHNLKLNELRTKCLINLATIAGETNNYMSAFEQYTYIIEQAKQGKISPNFIADAYIGLASCNLQLDNLDDALKFNKKAYIIYELLHDQHRLAILKNNFGHIHYRLNQYDPAIDNYLAAMNIYMDLNRQRDLAICYSFLTRAYIAIDNVSEAAHFAESALLVAKHLKDSTALAFACYAKGDVLRVQGNPAEAISMLENSERLFVESGKLNDLPELYNKLGNLYFETDNIGAGKAAFNKAMAQLLNKTKK